MRLKLKIWVVFGEQVKFGDGRAELPALIDELGSIHKAVARFGMCRREAGGDLRDPEVPPASNSSSAGPRSETWLLKQGKEFLDKSWHLGQQLEAAANRISVRRCPGKWYFSQNLETRNTCATRWPRISSVLTLLPGRGGRTGTRMRWPASMWPLCPISWA